MSERGVAQDHGGYDGDFVALENIGGHAGAIADVIADVIGDGSGIAWVVLGDVGFNFAHQVGADVGRLGINAAAHPHEKGQERTAETEPQQCLVCFFPEVEEDERAAQQAQAIGEHAGDRPGAVADLQGLAKAVLGRRRHP